MLNQMMTVVTKNDDYDRVQTICDKLSQLGAKYDAGDRSSTAPEIMKCTDELVDDGAVTNMDCQELRHQIIDECGHIL